MFLVKRMHTCSQEEKKKKQDQEADGLVQGKIHINY